MLRNLKSEGVLFVLRNCEFDATTFDVHQCKAIHIRATGFSKDSSSRIARVLRNFSINAVPYSETGLVAADDASVTNIWLLMGYIKDAFNYTTHWERIYENRIRGRLPDGATYGDFWHTQAALEKLGVKKVTNEANKKTKEAYIVVFGRDRDLTFVQEAAPLARAIHFPQFSPLPALKLVVAK